MTTDFIAMAVEICKKFDKEQRLCLLSDSHYTQKRQEFRMNTLTAHDLMVFKQIGKMYGYEVSTWTIAGIWQTDEIQVIVYYLDIPVKNGMGEL